MVKRYNHQFIKNESKEPLKLHTKRLLNMLTFRRPARSKTERRYINRFILPHGMEVDAFGNYYKRIGTLPIMWSSHTDTVHKEGGRQGIRLSSYGLITKHDKLSNCLGADCTAGNWLMLEMIQAGVEGLYIFHREEECGGNGSSWIAANNKELLVGIKAAIAFDRRGTSSIITKQAGGRCCSDAFGRTLASTLGMKYRLDEGGIFTDTANYTSLIGECTNVSVGYFSEHWHDEAQDIDHILALRDVLIRADFTKLEYTREPGEVDPADYRMYNWRGGYNDYAYSGTRNYGSPLGERTGRRTYGTTGSSSSTTGIDTEWSYTRNGSRWTWDDKLQSFVEDRDGITTALSTVSSKMPRTDYRQLVKLIEDHPHEFADMLLDDFGLDLDEIAYGIWQRTHT